jgi:hypothetical protein
VQQSLSDSVLDGLRSSVNANLDRYCAGGFKDLAKDVGWDVSLGVEFDVERLQTLDMSTPVSVGAVDMKNSIVIGEAFSQLTPALANEERVWARLSHVEAIDYARARWLTGADRSKLPSLINAHFFARSQTVIRDDNALSRLWWNYYIARMCMPDDVSGALALIMKTADIRSNFVERIWMTSRQSVAAGALRAMRDNQWVTGAEVNFRLFMKALNRMGGGIVFEVLSEGEVDEIIRDCVTAAMRSEAS